MHVPFPPKNGCSGGLCNHMFLILISSFTCGFSTQGIHLFMQGLLYLGVPIFQNLSLRESLHSGISNASALAGGIWGSPELDY